MMKNPLVETKAIKTKLRSPPLERALAAIAFTPVLRIADQTGANIADFQESLRDLYPEVELEHEERVSIQIEEDTARPLSEVMRVPVWRFSDLARSWRVSLTTRTVAVETRGNYAGRDDFVDRLISVVEAVEKAFHPAQATRIGIRYLNILSGAQLERLAEFVRPEFVAFGCNPYLSQLHSSVSVAQFDVPEGRLILKHGILAPNMPHEFMDTPAEEHSWYLDVDAATVESIAFQTGAVRDHANALTKRTGTMFNWAVTPAFMEAHDASR